jgi:hypothetical protein
MRNTGYDLTSASPGTFEGLEETTKEAHMSGQITIRSSTDADQAEIARLAALDSRQAPKGDVMLAFVDDELRAALGLGSNDAIADPFHPTADLVELLRMSAGQQDNHGLGLRAFRHAIQTA